MSDLTWKEFKELVNEADIPDDANIWYADFSFPCTDHDSCSVEIVYNEDNGVVIH